MDEGASQEVKGTQATDATPLFGEWLYFLLVALGAIGLGTLLFAHTSPVSAALGITDPRAGHSQWDVGLFVGVPAGLLIAWRGTAGGFWRARFYAACFASGASFFAAFTFVTFYLARNHHELGAAFVVGGALVTGAYCFVIVVLTAPWATLVRKLRG